MHEQQTNKRDSFDSLWEYRKEKILVAVKKKKKNSYVHQSIAQYAFLKATF